MGGDHQILDSVLRTSGEQVNMFSDMNIDTDTGYIARQSTIQIMPRLAGYFS